MDNLQTGAFIRELRKEQSMTQKDLAGQLHITDRAVSKWERGLCAPDLATLEPLAKTLGVTVTELLAGKRMEETPRKDEMEETVRSTLEYSRAELHQKTRTLKKGYRAGFLLIFALLLVLFATLWWNGVFDIVHRAESPDGANLLTVYDRDIAIDRFSREPRITVRTDFPPGEGWSTVIYSGMFQGAWWSPDSDKFVLAFHDNGTHRLVLHGHTTHSTSNLNVYLSSALKQSKPGSYDLQDSGSIFPEIEYQFLQWSLDSRSMLIYYSFTDTAHMFHEGYFWYNLDTGTAIAPLELE